MFSNIFRWAARLRNSRNGLVDNFSDEITYNLMVGSGHLFVVQAMSANSYSEIGRIAAESFMQTGSCFVFDVTVAPAFQKQGVATGLLLHALSHSQCKSIVPVSIEAGAISFWAHLAIEKRVPVRLGLMHQEVQALRYAMQPFRALT